MRRYSWLMVVIFALQVYIANAEAPDIEPDEATVAATALDLEAARNRSGGENRQPLEPYTVAVLTRLAGSVAGGDDRDAYKLSEEDPGGGDDGGVMTIYCGDTTCYCEGIISCAILQYYCGGKYSCPGLGAPYCQCGPD